MLLFTEGNPSLLTMYTQLLPVLLPRHASCHQLAGSNKESFQPAAELKRGAADKSADGSQRAPMGRGTADDFLTHLASLLFRKHKLSKHGHFRR